MDSVQKAVLIGVNLNNDQNFDYSMEELVNLSLAAGLSVASTFTQNKNEIDPKYYMGKGKILEELSIIIESEDVDLIVTNDELTSAQLKTISKELDIDVIDRTTLILDIFAKRATSKLGKYQIELAQLKYRKSRLMGIGISLSRQEGRVGTKGPGEQKLEIDRRRVDERISILSKKIVEEKKNIELTRDNRQKSNLKKISLIGYTNTGKSSLLNLLLSYDESKTVFAKDMLFATLDTYTRRINLVDNLEVLVSDTVGFVSKLPHNLIDAFKATLVEAKNSDLILHVVDISNPNYEFQVEVAEKVMSELKISDKPIIKVYNKIDKLGYSVEIHDGIPISVKENDNINLLIDRIVEIIYESYEERTIHIPFDKGHIVDYLIKNYKIVETKYDEKGTIITLLIDNYGKNKYNEYFI